MRRRRRATNGGRRPTRALALLGAGLLAAAWLKRRRDARRPAGATGFEPLGATLEERSEVIAGVRMRWLEHGRGHPVVLLHGIPTSPELWRRVMPRLRGARAHAWELVGYGASLHEGAGRDISLARQADYLAAWMRQRGLQGAVLAGHDLGGGVAQILAARHPGLCGGLLLANAVGYDNWPIALARALRAAGPAVGRLPAAALPALLGPLFLLGHDDPAVRRASARIHLRRYRGPGAAPALRRQLDSLDARDTLAVQDALPHLGVPARVVWGAADRFLEVRYGERFARDLGAPLRRIEGGLHFTPEDHPDVVAEALNELLREVEARTPASGA